MSLWLYKLGAYLNALVGLTILGVLLTLQVSPYLIVNLASDLGAPILETTRWISRFILNTESVRGTAFPIIIMVYVVLMTLVGGLLPFSEIKKTITGQGKQTSAFGYFMVGFVTIPLGGGLLMTIASIFGLRKVLAEKRQVWLFNNNQADLVEANEDNNVYDLEDRQDKMPVYEYEEESPRSSKRHANERSYNEEEYSSHEKRNNKELRKRISDLERRDESLKDDAYFAKRRDRRRVEDLEDELEHLRRRNRR